MPIRSLNCFVATKFNNSKFSVAQALKKMLLISPLNGLLAALRIPIFPKFKRSSSSKGFSNKTFKESSSKLRFLLENVASEETVATRQQMEKRTYSKLGAVATLASDEPPRSTVPQITKEMNETDRLRIFSIEYGRCRAHHTFGSVVATKQCVKCKVPLCDKCQQSPEHQGHKLELEEIHTTIEPNKVLQKLNKEAKLANAAPTLLEARDGLVWLMTKPHVFQELNLDSLLKDAEALIGFICEEQDCDFRSATIGPLNRHMRTKHSEEKNFRCDACGKTYKEKDTLKRHACKVQEPKKKKAERKEL